MWGTSAENLSTWAPIGSARSAAIPVRIAKPTRNTASIASPRGNTRSNRLTTGLRIVASTLRQKDQQDRARGARQLPQGE